MIRCSTEVSQPDRVQWIVWVTDDLAFVERLSPRIELNVTSLQEADFKRLSDELTCHRNAGRAGTDNTYVRNNFIVGGKFIQIL